MADNSRETPRSPRSAFAPSRFPHVFTIQRPAVLDTSPNVFDLRM